MKKNKNTIQRFSKVWLSAFAFAAILSSCTDLEIEQTDSNFRDANDSSFQGVTDPQSFVDDIYNQLRGQIGDQANLYALSEVTTDASLVPTRGSDWGDNGIWRQLHQHDWRPSHQFIENVWNQWNNTHFRAAQVLSDLTQADPTLKANASFLRALGMFVILDNYGQIPVRDVTATPFVDPEVISGQEAVDQIVSDLNDAIAGLPTVGPGSGVGDTNSPLIKATKASARYLLAKVLLNKHIYLKTEPATADMNQVITLVDAIAADGYALEDDYFDIFKNTLDKETIWFIPTAVGNRIWNGLHYNQSPEIVGGGWNGFATLAEYYDLFEGDANSNAPGSGQEERRGVVPNGGLPVSQVDGGVDVNDNNIADGSSVGFGFLIGQQFSDTGAPLNARSGKPLTFKRNFVDGNGNPSLINNDETTGIRVIKYNPRFGGQTEHEIFFRFSDAYLMKAEAMFRAGQDPTAMMNVLRGLREATPFSNAVTEQDIIDERGRELYTEFWRRNDLIRFGQYTKDWELKTPSEVGNDNRNLFPIPANQLILNPNLVQNPGY
ncbi:RagB/SusD family nutrient uptake outer membrane protein [Leeuwenhoekiella sp. MAR_2009_132]|uniref:RagB/SusD family nutrient uptake outer membrane protein n=1 Tax=Leeuwenhoekiella sp. MAR_2009_132 TaxID=1392489 RepID=UPI000490911F|nr:RagB/SusD family nutrient uptake outer membrane protein [Leeuwenhoekiella sp. MAR_2009_132]